MDMQNIIEKIKVFIKVIFKMENIIIVEKNFFQMVHFLMAFLKMDIKNMEHMNLEMVVNIEENF